MRRCASSPGLSSSRLRRTPSRTTVLTRRAPTAARMRVAAERVLAALPPAAREKVARPFDDRDRVDWHYTPRSRNGVALKELDAQGRDAVHALLKDGAVRRRLSQGRQHHRARARAARDRDVRPDARSRALSPHDLRHAEQDRARGAGASRAITCRSTSRWPATAWPSTRRASSAPIRPTCRRARRRACACSPRRRTRRARCSTSLSDAQRSEAVFDTRTFGDIVTAQRRQGRPAAAGRHRRRAADRSAARAARRS